MSRLVETSNPIVPTLIYRRGGKALDQLFPWEPCLTAKGPGGRRGSPEPSCQGSPMPFSYQKHEQGKREG